MRMRAPLQGDIILINLSPTLGHEQKGARPALVISKSNFNKVTQMCIVVPITNSKKGYPFEVTVTSTKTKGVILSDQIRTIDFIARKAKVIDKVTSDCLQKVLKKVKLVLE